MLGHTDFFKHNIWFQHTNRQMVESVSQNAQRIRQYGIDEGDGEVERFLDAVLALSEHVDPYPRREPAEPDPEHAPPGAPDPYGGLFPTDPAAARAARNKARAKARKVPAEPEPDLLRFLLEHADHLEDWQRDVIAIVREESLYFVPQMQTKIMNEGWATFWHSRIMREIDLTDGESLDFMRLHSAVCTPGRTRLNPYYLGLKIFEDIEERLGRDQIFAVREMENDASFLRSFLTEDLVHDLDLFVFALDANEEAWTITDKAWERVRDTLVSSMTNFGHPLITVEDGDYHGRRELYLRHRHDGRDLDLPYADKTLQYVHQLWGRPVHIETEEEGRQCLLTCEGQVVHKVYLHS